MTIIAIVDMQYDATSPQKSPLRETWQNDWDFGYWENRINKVNPDDPQDKLEPLFILLQLIDIYAHIFAAKGRSPNEPWPTLKEQTYSHHINDEISNFDISEDGETRIEVRAYNGDPDDIVGTQIRSKWKNNNDPRDFLLADFLGCPAELDSEEKEIVFIENPNIYAQIVNGTLTAWLNKRDLLNDLKHGFRLVPFNWETMEALVDEGLIQPDLLDLEEKKEEFEGTTDSYVYFWRFENREQSEAELPDKLVDEKSKYLDREIVVYRSKISTCIGVSEIILQLLKNLFGRGGQNSVTDQFGELTPENEDGPILVQEFFQGALLGPKS